MAIQAVHPAISTPRRYSRHVPALLTLAALGAGVLYAAPAQATPGADAAALALAAPTVTSPTYYNYTSSGPESFNFTGTAPGATQAFTTWNTPGNGGAGSSGPVAPNGAWSAGWGTTKRPTFAVFEISAKNATESSPVTTRLIAIVPPKASGTLQVFKQPSNPTLYQLVGSGATFTTKALTFNEWVAAGTPAPITLSAAYVKFPWSNDVFEEVYLTRDFSPNGLKFISADQWRALKYPAVDSVPSANTLRFTKWGTSDELFAVADGRSYKLTFAQWQGTGFRPYSNLSNQGYVKTANNSTVYKVSDLAANRGVPISFAQWQTAGYPTPRVVATAPRA